MLQVEFVTYKKDLRVYKSYSAEWIGDFVNELKKVKGLKNKERLQCQELSVIYVTKNKIKKLNHEYRGYNKPTDVLSFDGDGFFSLGELIICKSIVQEKAKVSNLTERLYLQLLISHGILHLFGYEHENDLKLEKEMFTLQNKLILKVAKRLAPKHKNEFDIPL